MPAETLFPLDQRKTLSSREVADRLGIDIRTVQKYAHDGILAAFQPRGKRGGWRFKRSDIEQWWAQTTGSNSTPPKKYEIRRRNRRKIQPSRH